MNTSRVLTPTNRTDTNNLLPIKINIQKFSCFCFSFLLRRTEDKRFRECYSPENCPVTVFHSRVNSWKCPKKRRWWRVGEKKNLRVRLHPGNKQTNKVSRLLWSCRQTSPDHVAPTLGLWSNTNTSGLNMENWSSLSPTVDWLNSSSASNCTWVNEVCNMTESAFNVQLLLELPSSSRANWGLHTIGKTKDRRIQHVDEVMRTEWGERD